MDEMLRFVELVNSPASTVDLTEGALLLSAHANPDLDLDHQRGRVTEIAGQCDDPTLDGLRHLLFDRLGFVGERSRYYHPANSFLDTVLDRRRGLPITLSLLTIEVGRHLGIRLDGVGMPGHFLVRDRTNPDVFIDPFAGGTVLGEQDCERLFRSVVGDQAPFDPAYLDPVPGTAILARMAANLVNAYRRIDDRQGLRWSARLRSRCPGVTPLEMRQLGQAMAHSGAFDEAAALLDDAASHLPEDEGASLRREADRFRARLN